MFFPIQTHPRTDCALRASVTTNDRCAETRSDRRAMQRALEQNDEIDTRRRVEPARQVLEELWELQEYSSSRRWRWISDMVPYIVTPGRKHVNKDVVKIMRAQTEIFRSRRQQAQINAWWEMNRCMNWEDEYEENKRKEAARKRQLEEQDKHTSTPVNKTRTRLNEAALKEVAQPPKRMCRPTGPSCRPRSASE